MSTPNNGPQIDPRLRESLVRQDQNDDPIELPCVTETETTNDSDVFQHDRLAFPWIRTTATVFLLVGLLFFCSWGINQIADKDGANQPSNASPRHPNAATSPRGNAQQVPSNSTGPALSSPLSSSIGSTTPISQPDPALNSPTATNTQSPRSKNALASNLLPKTQIAVPSVASSLPSISKPAPALNVNTTSKPKSASVPSPPKDSLVRVRGVDVNKPVDTIRVGTRDIEVGTARSLLGLTYSDMKRANTYLQSKQKLPDDLPPEAKLPEISPELKQSIAKSEVEFYRIVIGDCCYEDGDIAEVLVNGQSYTTVPMTNAGSSLSIPLQKLSPNEITVRGVKDGVGGITIYVRTSKGYHYCGLIEEGQELSLNVRR